MLIGVIGSGCNDSVRAVVKAVQAEVWSREATQKKSSAISWFKPEKEPTTIVTYLLPNPIPQNSIVPDSNVPDRYNDDWLSKHGQVVDVMVILVNGCGLDEITPKLAELALFCEMHGDDHRRGKTMGYVVMVNYNNAQQAAFSLDELKRKINIDNNLPELQILLGQPTANTLGDPTLNQPWLTAIEAAQKTCTKIPRPPLPAMSRQASPVRRVTPSPATVSSSTESFASHGSPVFWPLTRSASASPVRGVTRSDSVQSAPADSTAAAPAPTSSWFKLWGRKPVASAPKLVSIIGGDEKVGAGRHGRRANSVSVSGW